MPLSTWATALLVFVSVALGAVSIALLFEWLGERRRQKDVLGQLRKFERGLVQVGGEGTGILRRAVEESAFMGAVAARFPTVADLQMKLAGGGEHDRRRFSHDDRRLCRRVWIGRDGHHAQSDLCRPVRVLRCVAAVPVAEAAPGAAPRSLRSRAPGGHRPPRPGHPGRSSLSSGLKMVADETPKPIAGEFQRTFEEHRFGVPFDDVVRDLADRVDIVDVESSSRRS